jgi:two-component system, NarL family, response regulator NreC
MSIKLIIADDHELIREGVKHILSSQAGHCVVGEAADGRSAINLAERLVPDIVLMDIYMPGVNGIEATTHICASGSKSKVIALSGSTDMRPIRRMLTAGAATYVSKSWPARELLRAINAVHADQPYHYAGAGCVPHPLDEPVIPNAGTLSRRELQTLQLLATGKRSRDIAATMCVCVKAVEVYRRNLRRKLGRSSVAELTHYAIQEGIIPPQL